MTILNADDVKSLAVMGFGTMGHTWSTALSAGWPGCLRVRSRPNRSGKEHGIASGAISKA